MNKTEWRRGNNWRRDKHTKYYEHVQKLLKDWMIENNINEPCVVHHRDDTEECRKYNNEHYELWGHEADENGDIRFEYGKYVIFMTRAEHASHHHTGAKRSKETCEKISASNKGKIISDEQRAKLRAANIGKHPTEETRKKLSIAHSGSNHPMWGKHHTDETKNKISVAHKGKHLTEEHKNKLSVANTGKVRTQEMREKYRIANTGPKNPNFGKTTPDAVKEKMRAAHKAYSLLWNVYKNNNGILSFSKFRTAVKTGYITFEMQTISVFIK